MATEIGSLLIDMRADVARLAQDMAKAQNTVEGAMKNVQRSAAAAVTALGLIGVGVSVAGMANVVKGAVGAMAALDDMAARAGTTVEKMSALVDVAKIGGHDLGTMEGAMVRLTKALAGGDEEAKGAGRALATLGLKADELRGMDTADAMLAVAKALAQYENSAGKTALMLDLLGKSGAAAIPYLEDLAEAGELVAKVTREQAEEAEKLEKNFGRIKVAADDMVRSLTVPLVSALSDVVKNFNAARDAGYGFWQAATGIGVRGLGEGVGDAKANAGQRIQELQAEIAKHQRDKKFMTDRGDTQGARGYDAEIAAAQRRITYYKTLQRMAADEQWSGTSHLDARDLAARGKNSLAGYTSKDDKDPKKKKSNFDPEGDFDLKFAQMNEKARRANFDANDNAAKAETDAIEKLREKYVAMADPLQQYRVQLDQINMLREKGVLSADQALEAEWAVNEAMDKTVDKFGEVKDAGKGAFAELTQAIESWSNRTADVWADWVVDRKASFSDLITSMLKDIVRLQAKSWLDPKTKDASNWLSGGGLGKLFEGMFNPAGAPIASQGFGMAGDAGTLLGFANGGDFTVGGAGGTDSQLVAFRATPGENVSVRTPGQGSDSGGVTVVQHLNFSVGVAQTVRAEVMNMMPQIQAATQGAMMDARLRGGTARSAYRG
jgi:hypothetical protein